MHLVKVFNPALIFGTLTIAFFGSYACITLYEQYRLCSKVNKPKLMHPYLLLLLMAVSVGGVAIWAMHFVAMAGVQFYREDNHERVFARYRIDLTIASLVIVIFVSYAGLYICSTDKAFTQDQAEVIDSYVEEVRMKTIQEIKAIDSKRKLLAKSLFKNLKFFALGGVCIAGGVCVMHYIGMKAMVFDGYIRWNIGIISASVIIALVAGSAALWILFRLLALFPEVELLRFASAIIMAVAVNGMHYTGMAAGTFVHDPTIHPSLDGTVDQSTAVLASLVSAAIFLWITFILASADLRVWYYHLAFIVREADIRAEYYKKSNNGELDLFLEDYLTLRNVEYIGNNSRMKVRQQLQINSRNSRVTSENLPKMEPPEFAKGPSFSYTGNRVLPDPSVQPSVLPGGMTAPASVASDSNDKFASNSCSNKVIGAMPPVAEEC
jgi:NO-binding membrane sensor protein with MHYT domain